MKKLVFACLLGMLMSAGAVKAGSMIPFYMNSGPVPVYSFWVKFIFTFHRPKLDCQSGFGICFSVDYGVNKPGGAGNTGCIAEARISTANQLELKVSEDDLQNYESGFALPYFKSGSITLEDPYSFPEASGKKLGSGKILTLPAGTYPVIYNASARTYTVTFPV